MNYHIENGKLIIELEGRIDGVNAKETEQAINQIVADHQDKALSLDAKNLQYISSAGLRVLMKLCKSFDQKITILEVAPEVYDIFQTTGLDQILDVKKRLRELSIEGCEIIGEGGNGVVYRLDPETIVKVYYGTRNNPEKIRRNQAVTKDVFVHDIPTAIAFDMVRVGESYGVVYEMIDAKSLSQEIVAHPEKLEHYANMIADMLIKLHHTEFEKGSLPDSKDTYRRDIQTIVDAGYLKPDETARLLKLIDNVPERYTFVHQDFHTGNLMLQKGELVLIDVEDAGLGHPVLDLASMYLVYVSAAKAGWTKKNEGIDAKDYARIWDIILRKYFNTDSDDEIAEINRILHGYSRVKFIRGVATSPRIPNLLRRIVIGAEKRKLFKILDTLHPIP